MERDTIGCSGTLRDLGKRIYGKEKKWEGERQRKETNIEKHRQEDDIKTDEVRKQ